MQEFIHTFEVLPICFRAPSDPSQDHTWLHWLYWETHVPCTTQHRRQYVNWSINFI